MPWNGSPEGYNNFFILPSLIRTNRRIVADGQAVGSRHWFFGIILA